MAISLEQAHQAKQELKHRLTRPPWLRGIGIGQDETGGHVIEVRVEADTPAIREAIPDNINGVPIRVTAVGGVHHQ